MAFVATVAIVLAACEPRAERTGSRGAGTGAAIPAAPAGVQTPPATTVGSGPAVSREALRERLIAAGLGVLKEPVQMDDFELASIAGGTAKLSSFRGRLVFLNFWATWCPPCRAEMPSMERLYRRLRAKGLEVVGVDLQESKAEVQKFVKERSLSFTVLLDTTGDVGGSWGAQSIPTTYLIDRSGGVFARAVGGREWDSDEMIALFEALLAAE
jgi:thiol-disulfide isomerase/thioredoxin